MKLSSNLSIIGAAQAAFVDTALDAMRDSDFLSKSDQRIIADQSRLVESGVTFSPERQAIFIEANGECDSSFPTFDGTCVAEGNKGRTARALARLVAPAYCDGESTPRCDREGNELPNARQLSNVFHSDTNDSVTDPSNMSHMHMLWGQFLTHDIVLTPGTKVEGVDCACGSTNAECHNIAIPEGDPHMTKECIPMKRSHRTFAEWNGKIYQEQVSVISAFVDGTVVYGTDKELTHTLRHQDRNGLVVSFNDDGVQLLPRTNESSLSPPAAKMSEPMMMADSVREKFKPKEELNEQGKPGFVAGDARINEHPALQGLHTVFHLLHNWAVTELEAQNPSWKGMTDMLFQEARMVVIASIQNISYGSYLTGLLGADYAAKHGLTPAGKVSSFDESKAMDPTIVNEFSSAALRFGHSQINNPVPCLNPEWEEMELQEASLQDNFFDPALLEKYGTDAIMRGNLATPGLAVDTNFADDVRNNLFKSFGSDEGGDLFAINIQRGREHGIGSYLDVRRWCRSNGYAEAVSYKPGMQSLLESEYDNNEDIDLYVGGLAEEHLPGAVVGPTFGCIFAEQFKRLKSANKYFFTNDNVYSNDQLKEVKKLDLAAVLCAVAHDMETVPRDPFYLGDHVDCSKVKMPDFSVWTAASAPKHSLFSCPFDAESGLMNCNRKNWSEVKYLIESASVMGSAPARLIDQGFRAVDFDLVGKAADKAAKKKAKAEKKKNKKDKKNKKNKNKGSGDSSSSSTPEPAVDNSSTNDSGMAQVNAGDVKYISLRGNKLPNDREIAQLVKAFPNLKGIDVSNNQLNNIPPEVFALSDWRVSGNNVGCISLSTIEEGFRPNSNFKDEL